LQPVRLAMERALAADHAATTGSGAAQASSGAGRDGAEPPLPGVPPARVTRAMMQHAFAPMRDQMLRCLDGATSRPGQLPLTFRYDGAGAISDVTVTPAQWTPCVAPIAATVHLPPSQVAREIGIYYVLGDTP